MTPQITLITRLTEQQIDMLTENLKEAYNNNEYAFGVTGDDLVSYYRNIAKDIADGKMILAIATMGDEIVGSAIAQFENGELYKHLAYLSKVIIQPVFKRKGIASSLIQILENAAKKRGKERFSLCVTEGNLPAIELYHKLGFKQWGIAHNEAKLHGKYYNEVYMEKFL